MLSYRLAASKFACRHGPRVFSTNAEVPPVSKKTQKDHDPMEIFAQFDTNGDGVISKVEFKEAMTLLEYNDLLKIRKSLARNEFSYNPSADEDLLLEVRGHVLRRRLQVTAEVAISKIFPAGFGWQTAATFADGAGLQSTDISFFLATGLGDGAMVALGHTGYMALKKAYLGASDEEINLSHQAQTGVWLGSAAVCSGSIWQPTVNALQATGWNFTPSVVVTSGVAVGAFYVGLRLGRAFYGKMLHWDGVENANYSNLKADAALSLAVGGAAGAFLGTDVSYGVANWLNPLVGIKPDTAAVTASLLAGSSTALGFSAVQMGQNIVYPKDKCWVD